MSDYAVSFTELPSGWWQWSVRGRDVMASDDRNGVASTREGAEAQAAQFIARAPERRRAKRVADERARAEAARAEAARLARERRLHLHQQDYCAGPTVPFRTEPIDDHGVADASLRQIRDAIAEHVFEQLAA